MEKKGETVTDFIFSGSEITVDNDCRHEIKILAHWKENYDKSRQRIKKQRHHFATKAPLVKATVFSSSHIQMWEWDHKEGWARKNCCLRTVVLEKTLESPLDLFLPQLSFSAEYIPRHKGRIEWCLSHTRRARKSSFNTELCPELSECSLLTLSLSHVFL